MDRRVTVKLWHRSLDANSVNIEQSQFHSYVQFHFTQRVEMNVSAQRVRRLFPFVTGALYEPVSRDERHIAR